MEPVIWKTHVCDIGKTLLRSSTFTLGRHDAEWPLRKRQRLRRLKLDWDESWQDYSL